MTRPIARWTWTGLALAEAAVAAVVLLGLAVPSTAQFFDERFPFFDNRRNAPPLFAPPRPPPPADNSHAPGPRKAEKNDSNLTTVLVMGDSMADWLGYGLETAFQDSPDTAVVRKFRTWSSLIFNPGRHEFRNRNNVDWAAHARDILAKEQPSFVVMMIGLSDRDPIRERVPPKPATPAGATKATTPPKTAAAPAVAPAATPAPVPAPAEKTLDSEQSPPTAEAAAPREEPPAEQPPAVIAEERPTGTGTHEFKSEKWTELYTKRVDEIIGVLKSKGVPVIWVGLPPIRGNKSMTEISYLNDLYRSRADKAGITYVDVWDGFIDEGGRYAVQGPDYEGQFRRLRSADGVHFTQAGARKLAHYVEKEIQRAMTHTGPVAVALPVEQAAPAVSTAPAPGSPVTRPMSGPVIPLNAMNDTSSSEELLGAGGSSGIRQTITDAVASRVLIRGEPVPAPAGRADDFIWPRRGPAPVGTDPVVATTSLPMTPMVAERAAIQGTASAAATPGAPAAAAKRPSPPRTARPPGYVGQREAARRNAQQPPSPFFFFFGGR